MRKSSTLLHLDWGIGYELWNKARHDIAERRDGSIPGNSEIANYYDQRLPEQLRARVSWVMISYGDGMGELAVLCRDDEAAVQFKLTLPEYFEESNV